MTPAEHETKRQRVIDLIPEIEVFQAQFDKARTYENALLLQNRQIERRVLVTELRGAIRLVRKTPIETEFSGECCEC